MSMYRIKTAKMFNNFSLLFIIFMLNFQKSKSTVVRIAATPEETFNEECETLKGLSPTISYHSRNYYSLPKEMCWIKRIPKDSILIFKFEALSISSQNYRDGCNDFIEISEWTQGEKTKVTRICYSNQILESGIAFHDVKIKVVSMHSSIEFTLKFTRESLACHTKEAFKCSDFCIPRDKVCDGFFDCEDGADELHCDNRILPVEGVEESRSIASSWLEKNSNSSSWKKNLHRTIVALYLSGKANFSNGDYLSKNNLLANQLELHTTVALLRNSTDPVSSNELSMILNALLVTCRNPRQFYGFNLVQLLKEQITFSDDMIQPVAYLALCNAHEPLPKNIIDQLLQVLKVDSKYLFLPELQAIAVMTISCLLKTGQGIFFNETNLEVYNSSVEKLKQIQNEDGSFGNVYTTALITQALISKGEKVSVGRKMEDSSDGKEDTKDWNMIASVKFLMKQISSKLDYLSTYYVLPILNMKSLADIAHVDCTEFNQNADENSASGLTYKLGPKMQIQYSLYLGTNKDVIHTIYLSVPKTNSAYETMQFAALQDPKYRFQSKSMSGKVYVFEINGYINDPEAGLFWLNYLKSERFNDTLVHCETSPDEIKLQENDHLVMWYKRAHI